MTTNNVAKNINTFCPVGIGGTKGIDTTHLKIFVGGLSPDHTSQDLYNIFRPFGVIRESVVIPDRFRVRSRCYGFVTFSEHDSVSSVFQQLPILTARGAKLTVVLASANTKPRRAHFNVKHGTSGHKPLPMVKEEEDEQAMERMLDPVNSIMVRTKLNTNSSKYHKKSKPDDRKIGIYTDPSLFRTANIQPIAPATLHIVHKAKKEQNNELWPNEDIKKDFHHLKKVVVAESEHSDDDMEQIKSWKLLSVTQESDQYSCYEDESLLDEPHDFYNQNSRKWTPISDKRRPIDSLANSVVSAATSYHSRSSPRKVNSRKNGNKKCKSPKKWVKSPKKDRNEGLSTSPSVSVTAGCDTKGGVDEGEQHKTDGHDDVVQLDLDVDDEEEDRLTFASLFDGSYQRLIMEQQDAVNMNMTMINYQKQYDVASTSAAQPPPAPLMNEMETLRHIFMNRMNNKIGGNNQYNMLTTQPVFNQNQNGTWSPYQPAFGISVGAVPSVPVYLSDHHSQSNAASASNHSLHGTPNPNPATNPNVSQSQSPNSLPPPNGNAALYNFDQRNVVYNTNYFYGSASMTGSQSNQ